jgi:hypothetical protein
MLKSIVTGVAMACALLVAHAQQQDTTPPQNAQLQKQEIANGTPARWSNTDQSSSEQSRTLRKEIGAALAEAKQACQKGPPAERGNCLKQAQQTYQDDMAKVAQTVAQSPTK